LYGPSGETRFAAGTINGRLVYNASERFDFRHWKFRQAITPSGFHRSTQPSRPGTRHCSGSETKHGELMIFAGQSALSTLRLMHSVFRKHTWVEVSHIAGPGSGIALGTIQAITGRQKTP